MDVSTVRWSVVHFGSGDNDSGSPPVMQVFASVACRLFFIADKNTQLMVVTKLKKKCFVAENLLNQKALLCCLYLLCFAWK